MKTDTARTREARIGVISDTDGLLRPEALALLQCCDPISIAELLISNGAVSARILAITPT